MYYYFSFLNKVFNFETFPFISPKKNDIPKPIIAIIIAITELIFKPNTQLSFKTLGIIDKNKPKIIENVIV